MGIYSDYNERNLGLVKLRAKYPDASEEEIYTMFFGRKRVIIKHQEEI